MKHGLLFSGTAIIGILAMSAFPGCSSSNGNNNNGDGGPSSDSSSSSGSSSGGGDDGSMSDGPAETSSSSSGGDGAMPCSAMVQPAGTPLVASATASVQGVTSDGQVIYYDSATKNLSAVPAAGGTPATIGPWDKSQSIIYTAGPVALYWNGTPTTAPVIGALSIWTAAGGMKALGTKSYFGAPGGQFVDVSPDGSLILYTDNATATSADIYVASVDADGGAPYKLVSGASIGTNCQPVVKFAGDTAVVSYCTAQPDAGTTLSATVAAYSSAPDWQTTQTFTTAGFFGFSIGSTTTDGGQPTYSIEYLTSSGMYVEGIGGTQPTLIDAAGEGGLFTHAGTDVLYFRADGSVWRSSVATPAPAEISAGPYAGTLALSADDNWLETYANQSSSTGFTDMYLFSTTPADGGNASTTLTSATTGANFGDPFTADSSHVLFFPNITTSGTSGYVGSYDDFALPPSGTPATISNNVWEEFATTGAKTVFDDNYQPNIGFSGYGDIKSIDLSASGAMPTTLVSSADANFFVTADKKNVVYSWSACPGAKDGIYTVAAP